MDLREKIERLKERRSRFNWRTDRNDRKNAVTGDLTDTYKREREDSIEEQRKRFRQSYDLSLPSTSTNKHPPPNRNFKRGSHYIKKYSHVPYRDSSSLRRNSSILNRWREETNVERNFTRKEYCTGGRYKQGITRKLEQLTSQLPSEILLVLIDPKNGFNELFQNPIINSDTLVKLIKVTARGFASQMHVESLHQLMGTLLGSNLFQLHIPKFVSSFLTKEHIDLTSVFTDLIAIFECFMTRMPSIASESLNASILLCTNVLDTIIKRGQTIDDKLLGNLQTIQKLVDKTLRNKEDLRKKQQKTKCGETFIQAPNDFRDLPIIPTIQEIVASERPFLRKNIIDSKYKNVEHYLDIQFRLFREDFIAPLRMGICDYMKEPSQKKKQRKYQDVRIYENVQIHKILFNQNYLIYELKFDIRPLKRIKWKSSRRLMFGSLLCLSPDHFQTCRFVSVINREVEELRCGFIKVKVEDEIEKGSLLTNAEIQLTYTMAESPAYFEAYRHILLGLQRINDKNMPFQEYIIQMKTKLVPPIYLGKNSICDLSFMNPILNSPSLASKNNKNSLEFESGEILQSQSEDDEKHVRRKIFTTHLSTWPSAEIIGLDDSQRRAMHLALSSSVAVIQGPPGTGKTFVGLKIVQALVQNNPRIKPILIVCLTNHALDQFLEGVLSFTRNLVRVGGRSENQWLNPYKMKNLISRQNVLHNSNALFIQKMEIHHKLKRCQSELCRYKEDVKSMNKFLLHEMGLKDLPESDLSLLNSLKTSFIDYEIPVNSKIAAWLGISVNDFISDYQLLEFYYDYEDNKNVLAQETKQDNVKVDNDGLQEKYDDNEDLVDAGNEALIESKNRMLDMEYDIPTDYTMERSDVHRSECWHTKIDSINDPYYMYAVNAYVHIPNNPLLQWVQSNYEYLQGKFNIMKSIVKRELSIADEMQDGEVREIMDLWSMDLKDRWRLYRRWLAFFHEKRKRQIEELQREYKELGKQMINVINQQEYRILKDCTIIGMTTTGAAKYQPILYEIGCKIVIIEEAAEVLETHVISTLNPKTEHLILIGDHLQLRPKPTVYYLSKEYNFNISLFERLIKNGLPFETLELQHRMKPEISRLVISLIYPQLRDHPSVLNYPSIVGIKSCIFFINHTKKEQEVDDTKSFVNQFEAEYIVSLCHYLIKQGYIPSSITILTLYIGQVFAIRKLMPKSIFEGVRVVAVDNYQGEENDVILLSLVRSNDKGKIGFVKEENRINVALSRARHGLYAVGNFKFLAQHSVLWKNLTNDLEKRQLIGPALTIVCKKHSESQVSISKGEEFLQFSPEGGCLKKCEARLDCGHHCQRVCHFDNHDICTQPCILKCPAGHSCSLLCNEECKPCRKLVNKCLPCGHNVAMLCYENTEDHKCLVKVIRTLKCGHENEMPCSMKQENHECLVNMLRTLPCGHSINLPCNIDFENYKCHRKIERTLSCGHTIDLPCFTNYENYKCNKLIQRILPHCQHKIKIECHRDLNNVICKEMCDYRLFCGHKCERKCHPLIDVEHTEGVCNKPCQRIICKQHNQNCDKKCANRCSTCKVKVEKTLNCGHKIIAECGITGPSCEEPCGLYLNCGHLCKKKCGQLCNTECNELIEKVLNCGHEIQVKCHMRNFDQLNLIQDCKQPCMKILACGHPCQNLCYETCTSNCRKEVIRKGICTHDIKIHCHMSSDHCELFSRRCREPCSQLLSCKHRCKGTCGECFQGRVHIQCKRDCGRIQICGHSCNIPCSEICPPCNKRCSNRCKHSRCPSRCGFPCMKCKERCEWKCTHYKCSRLCSEQCDRPPCNEPCTRKLRCGHPCIGFCGEKCPSICRTCRPDKLVEFILSGNEDEPNARFIQLEDCDHCIEVSGLDRWMNMESDIIQMKCCPICKSVIWRSQRYGNLIRECIKNIQIVKKRLFGSPKQVILKKKQLNYEILNSKEISENFPRHYSSICRRLMQGYVLNYTECVVIENQIKLLKAFANTKERRSNLHPTAKDYLVTSMERLVDRLMVNEQKMSEDELNSINKELNRINLHASLIDIKGRLSELMIDLSIDLKEKLSEITTILQSGKVLTEEQEKNFTQPLEQMHRLVGTSFTKAERVMIVKAMNLKKGAWYKCPNGHIYAIGDCGGAMQLSRCNECGASIGGSSHRLVEGNTHAGEMDGSSTSAWPATADMQNYEM